jgi:hypothetical protein
MAEICSANSRVDNRSRQLAGLLLGSPPAARLHNRTRDVQFFQIPVRIFLTGALASTTPHSQADLAAWKRRVF